MAYLRIKTRLSQEKLMSISAKDTLRPELGWSTSDEGLRPPRHLGQRRRQRSGADARHDYGDDLQTFIERAVASSTGEHETTVMLENAIGSIGFVTTGYRCFG
jgi:hypothetical protein